MFAELHHLEKLIARFDPHLASQCLCHVRHRDTDFPVYALSLGCTKPTTPAILFVGGIHGLERIGTQVVLAFLESLLRRLRWDTTLDDILERINILFLPLVNPVGMLRHTRANGNGIDLMRDAPVESAEPVAWLAGGHRISPKLPWYRGESGQAMETEAAALCQFVADHLFHRPFSLVLDCHSGFGVSDRIWFPYAKSRLEPIPHLGEVFHLRKLFFQTYPYQNYQFEPQSLHYLTHGDLWDYLYQQALDQGALFLPLTLEMGSWRWIRKNPLQLFNLLGLFHPIKPHRINRVLRGHLVLMEFLVRATLSHHKWFNAQTHETCAKQAKELWYPHAC